MSVLELIPKTPKPEIDVSEVLDWLDRTKEQVVLHGVHSIAIAWVDSSGGTGSGYIANKPITLLGAIEVCKREIFENAID